MGKSDKQTFDETKQKSQKNHNYKHLFFIKSFINRFDVKIVLNISKRNRNFAWTLFYFCIHYKMKRANFFMDLK